MLRPVRAIVRTVIPEVSELKPGMVVRVNYLAFAPRSGPKFPVVPEIGPDLLFWVEPKYLLTYAKFLHRQPYDEFWNLILKERLRRKDSMKFLSDPWRETIGTNAFRFESIGELRHYLDYHILNPAKFRISHVLISDLNNTNGQSS
jgi:hypothetical protein